MTKYYPASLHQIEDWHINYIARKKHVANFMRLEVKLPADIDVLCFERAFAMLIQRHEALRTCFPMLGGEIVQRVEDYDASRFSVLHVDTGSSSEFSAICKRNLFGFKDLKNGPLVRGILWHKRPDRSIFLFLIHHIISDHWSVNLLHYELETLYVQCTRGAPPTLPKIELQWGEYIERNKEERDGNHERTIQFWINELADSAWRVDFNRVYGYAGRMQGNAIAQKSQAWDEIDQTVLYRRPFGQLYVVCMEADLFNAIRAFCAQTNLSTYGVLVAALNLLAVRFTANRNVLIRSHFNSRLDIQSERVVGNFIGALFLYNRVDDGLTVKEFIIQCYQSFLDAADKVIYNSERLHSLGVLIRCFLHFNFIGKKSMGTANFPVRAPYVENSREIVSPLFCAATEYANTIVFKWGYHSLFYNNDTVSVMVNEYFDVLRSMLKDGDREIKYFLSKEPAPVAGHF